MLNNPVRYTDPSGMFTQTHRPTDNGQQRQQPPPQPQPPPAAPAVHVDTGPDPAPPSTITNATPEQRSLLSTGNAEAASRLLNPTCEAFFGGAANGAQALSGLTFLINPAMPASGTPQARIDGSNVQVNPNGGPMTPDDSSRTFFLLNPVRHEGWLALNLSGVQARAFGQLHEAAHRAGSYGATDIDGTKQTWVNNFYNNWKLWKACFSDTQPTRATTMPLPPQ